MPIDKTQRWLDLLAYLTQRHYPVTRAQLMEGVPAYSRSLDEGADPESVRRTFERDKQELLALGIPLETIELGGEEADEQAGYKLRSRDFYLPYLKILREGAPLESPPERPRLTLPSLQLDLDQLQLARDGLRVLEEVPDFPYRAEARSAYRKLSFDLAPPGERDAGPETVVARDDPPEVTDRTAVIARAMETRKEIRFTYAGAYRAATTARRVHPYGLLFKRNHWYLVGHDLDREAVRVFRLSRMEELAMNTRQPGTPDFERPGDFSLAPWRDAEPWSLPADETEPTDVLVRVRFPQSLVVERNGLGTLERPEPGGDQIRRFEVRQVDAFLRWMLTHGGEVEPLDPPEVVEAFRALARRVAHRYREAAS